MRSILIAKSIKTPKIPLISFTDMFINASLENKNEATLRLK